MAKERLKIVQAGTLWMAVQYTAIRGSDPGQRREMKSMISTPARESLNAKLSWQRLMLILAANFRSSDLVVTLTYRDEQLPRHREEAIKRIKYFIRLLRKARSARGQPLRYVYTTEGYHSGGRLHHHLIVNDTGGDYCEIMALWRRNGDNVDFEGFGRDGPERWGKYLTKEPREKGRRHVGDRSWSASRNLKKPETESTFVTAGTALLPPAGAFILDRAECENCYGRFSYVMARLQEADCNAGGDCHAIVRYFPQ